LPLSTIAGDFPHQKLFQDIPDYSYFKAFFDVSVFLILMLYKERRKKFSQKKIVGVYLCWI
jgi:hypothetical protein